MPKHRSPILVLLLTIAFTLCSLPALAAELRDQAKGLVASDATVVRTAVEAIAARRDADGLAVLDALLEGTLRVDAAGGTYAARSDGSLEPLIAGLPAAPSGALSTPLIDNRLRRVIEPAIAYAKLESPELAIRLAAATELSKQRNDELAPFVRKLLVKEQDSDVRDKLALALAHIDLSSDSTKLRLDALRAIDEAADAQFKPQIQRILEKDEKGAYREQNAEVRAAASRALSSIELHALFFGMIGHLFYGLSLGSVLLLASLGLAITFGLMRVINMAHGELLMIGAYATFAVQKFFQSSLPAAADWYLVCAVPVAFLASMLVGMLIERTVLRFLYGRPLETLLATWGISLMLIQTVRLLFGAQNVAVANPSWLAGGVELLPGFVLTYSRVAVILFSAVVVAFVWFVLQRTPLGLSVRAVTQNRGMAASMGISTRRVDLWTFGMGSGVAGLGGVALSQLGNVGPELGQGYIVDSFMVVVLGGVGKLAGTLAGSFGLGIVNKLLEPAAGAVLGKIAILAFIILFIQRRPQGIFALKGRAAEIT
jgi:urea transport system permease protein